MLNDEEGIAYTQFGLNRCVEPKQFHDVGSYYTALAFSRWQSTENAMDP
jgi:hypothetical protein